MLPPMMSVAHTRYLKEASERHTDETRTLTHRPNDAPPQPTAIPRPAQKLFVSPGH